MTSPGTAKPPITVLVGEIDANNLLNDQFFPFSFIAVFVEHGHEEGTVKEPASEFYPTRADIATVALEGAIKPKSFIIGFNTLVNEICVLPNLKVGWIRWSVDEIS